MIKVFVRFDVGLAVNTAQSMHHQDKLLKQVDQSVLSRRLLASNMMDRTLLPNVENFFDILGKNEADNRGADVPLFQKNITHGLDCLIALLDAPIEIGIQVS